jgi:hypothetical protein
VRRLLAVERIGVDTHVLASVIRIVTNPRDLRRPFVDEGSAVVLSSVAQCSFRCCSHTLTAALVRV